MPWFSKPDQFTLTLEKDVCVVIYHPSRENLVVVSTDWQPIVVCRLPLLETIQFYGSNITDPLRVCRDSAQRLVHLRGYSMYSSVQTIEAGSIISVKDVYDLELIPTEHPADKGLSLTKLPDISDRALSKSE